MIGHIFRVQPYLNSTTPLCGRKDYGLFAEENVVPQMLSDLPETEVPSSAKLDWPMKAFDSQSVLRIYGL